MSEVRGNIDLIQGNCVLGWVALQHSDGLPLRVQLQIDGELVAHASAGGYREDIASLGISDGFSAFRLSIPSQFLDNRTHLINVEVPGYDFKFESLPRKVRLSATSYAGAILRLEGHTLSGWARSNDSRSSVAVELLAGDTVLQVGRADQLRAEGSSPPDGFHFTLGTGDLASLRSAPLRVRVAHTDVILPMGPSQEDLDGQIRALFSQYRTGDVCLNRNLIAEGWYVDRLDLNHRFTVEAIDEQSNRVIACGRTGRKRTIELDGQPRTLPCGFRLELPTTLLDGQHHSVRLRFDGRAALQVLTVDGGVAGECRIDRITAQTVEGWALSYADPTSPAIVEVTVDGAICGVGTANIFRPDLADALRTSGAHAFHVHLEKPLAASALGRLKVRLRDSAIEEAASVDVLAAAHKLLASSQPSQTLAAADRLIGQLDRVRPDAITGWAIDTGDLSKRVRVELLVAGVPLGGIMADLPRPDVASVHGTDGRHGFHFDLPIGLGFGSVEVAVRFADTHKLLADCPQTVDLVRPGFAHPRTDTAGPRGLDAYAFRPAKPLLLSDATQRVAVIVINRNGADHLAAMFASFERFNTYPNYRIVVVDHGSSDASEAVCGQWAKTLHVQFLQRGENFSYSNSNNFGASNAEEEVLLLLNNDIVLSQCLLTPMLQYLADERVGAVGIKLRSPPVTGEGVGHSINFGGREGFIQHLGIKFQHYSEANPLGPYELPLHPDAVAIANSAWHVPAVTAAAMMVRRRDFLDVGGFDETYFYGYEDVDFCLALSGILNKQVICANDITAYHVKGATKTSLDFRARSRFNRNVGHLRSRFGAKVRQSQRREALAGERFFRMEPLRIAFAVNVTEPTDPESDFADAYRLGARLAEFCRWDVGYLDRNAWYELDSYDLVVAMSPDWDPGKVIRRHPGLVRVAWLRDSFDRWLQRPWLSSFDAVWSASKKAVRELADRIPASCDLVRTAADTAGSDPRRPDPEFASDYCVTGNLPDRSREILAHLDPEATPYRLRIFGRNWGSVAWLSSHWQGACTPSDMAKVFASTKIVLDDSDYSAKGWDLVHNRVADAIAAGALVLTTDKSVSDEVFGGLLPVFTNRTELTELLERYLGNEPLRQDLVEKLRRVVIEHYSAEQQAKAVQANLARIYGCLWMSIQATPPSLPAELSNVTDLVAYLFRDQDVWIRRSQLPSDGAIVENTGNESVLDDIVWYVSTGEAAVRVLAPDQINIRIHFGSAAELSAKESGRYDILILASPEPNAGIAQFKTQTLYLFDNADACSRCFTVDGEGLLSIRDPDALRHALAKHVPQIMAVIEKVNSERTTLRRGPPCSSGRLD